MHTIKIDMKEYGNTIRITCPYCNSEQGAPAGKPYYQHSCIEAGQTYLMNGYMFVDVPEYMFKEKQSTLKHD